MASCIPEISVDTVIIYEHLTMMKPGEIVTYSDLAKYIGRSVPSSMLVTARKKALSDNHMVFGTIRLVGLKLLSDIEIVKNAPATFRTIQNATRREAKRLAAVVFETLGNPEKIKHSASSAALAVINRLATPKQVEVLELKAADGMRKLSMMQALDAIREAEGATEG